MVGKLSLGGEVANHGAGWKLRNWARPVFLWGLLWYGLAKLFTKASGIPTIVGELRLRHYHAGEWVDLGVASYRVVTDAAVALIVSDFNNNAADVSLWNFHGFGTGTTAEAASQTTLVTEATTAINPDSTRSTGVRSTPAANQYRTVATMTFDASAAIAEHGVFTQAAVGGGTLLDRSMFAVVNVASGDSIEATYTYTINSGG